VTGWGANDQQFSPVNYEDYYTSSYIGIERKFGERLNRQSDSRRPARMAVVGANSGIAQNLRPAGTVDFMPNHKWDVQVSSAYSSTRSFHVYDAIQNGFPFPMQGRFTANSMTIPERCP
jgi:hypothetical protein